MGGMISCSCEVRWSLAAAASGESVKFSVKNVRGGWLLFEWLLFEWLAWVSGLLVLVLLWWLFRLLVVLGWFGSVVCVFRKDGLGVLFVCTGVA